MSARLNYLIFSTTVMTDNLGSGSGAGWDGVVVVVGMAAAVSTITKECEELLVLHVSDRSREPVGGMVVGGGAGAGWSNRARISLAAISISDTGWRERRAAGPGDAISIFTSPWSGSDTKVSCSIDTSTPRDQSETGEKNKIRNTRK